MAFSFYRRPIAKARFTMSFSRWLRNGKLGSTVRRSPAARPRCLPKVELLEDRLAPATVSWDGGPAGTGTNWNTAANWVGDVLPGSGDTAQIGAAFAGVTISTSVNVTISGLT